MLVKQRSALEEFLDVAPTALSNLQLAYDPESCTLDTRDNNVGRSEADPFGAVCNALVSAGQDPSLCEQLAGALQGLPLPPPVRLPALRQILVTYPSVVAGGFTVAPGDGTTHFGLVTDDAPPICERGYEDTQKRSPFDTSPRTPHLSAGCELPEGDPSSVRGGARAPRPDEAEATSGTRSGTASSSRVPSVDESGDAMAFGGYDPSSGRVITADGEQLSIGSTNGAQRVFGKDSWQWLLLGPLSR